jgi:hypothetical protein
MRVADISALGDVYTRQMSSRSRKSIRPRAWGCTICRRRTTTGRRRHDHIPASCIRDNIPASCIRRRRAILPTRTPCPCGYAVGARLLGATRISLRRATCGPRRLRDLCASAPPTVSVSSHSLSADVAAGTVTEETAFAAVALLQAALDGVDIADDLAAENVLRTACAEKTDYEQIILASERRKLEALCAPKPTPCGHGNRREIPETHPSRFKWMECTDCGDCICEPAS